MEKVYICTTKDFDDIVNVMNASPLLYGHNTKDSGILDLQINYFKKILELNEPKETAKELIVAHSIDGKITCTCMMTFWQQLPAWTSSIGFSSYDLFNRMKLHHTITTTTKFMMEIAESRGYYDYYLTVRHSTSNFKRELVSHSDSSYPRYNFNKIEIIDRFNNSRFKPFQLNLLANKNSYPLAVMHGSCKTEFRKILCSDVIL